MAGKEVMTEWRVLRDYPDYKISTQGDVHDRRTNRPLIKQNMDGEVFYVLRNPHSSRESVRKQTTLMTHAFPNGVE